MCPIGEHTNSFAVLCNWIRELSNSIKELTKDGQHVFNMEKMLELGSSPIQLQSSLIE